MMSDVQSIEKLFQELIELPSDDQRRKYLDRVCGDDTEKRRQLEKLAESHKKAGSFLQDDELEETLDSKPPAHPGGRIGPYKIRELIGEGGMGSVYVAEQERPVKRKVALKLIKPGMDTKEVIARFEAERQALAMMDHPSIAKVFDAGMTENGRPFFAMERPDHRLLRWQKTQHSRKVGAIRTSLSCGSARASERSHPS